MLSLLPPALLTRTLLRNVLEAADLGPFYRSFSRYGVTAAGRFGSQQDALLELLELTEDDTAHGCGEGHLRWLLGRAGFAVANFSYLLGSRLVAAATRPAVASLPANAEINWVARAIRY